MIGLPLDVTFPRLKGIRWRYCTRWDEGPAAVLGMSLLRLGICRSNDWSGSAVDFVERGFRRFCSQNRAADVKKVWVGDLRITDSLFELTEQERNQVEADREGMADHLYLVGGAALRSECTDESERGQFDGRWGYFGDQMLRDWAPVLGFLGILPPGVGGGGGGGGGGVVNAPGKTPNEVSMRMYPVSPGLSPGYTGSGPPPANQPSGNTASPGPGPKSSSNVDPLALLAMLAVLSNGGNINPAQPAPQPDEEADDSLDDEDAVQDACGGDGDGGAARKVVTRPPVPVRC